MIRLGLRILSKVFLWESFFQGDLLPKPQETVELWHSQDPLKIETNIPCTEAVAYLCTCQCFSDYEIIQMSC